MRILSLTEDQHNEVIKFTSHIEDELVKLVPDMIFAGPGYPLNILKETVDESVTRLMPDADWVLDWNPWFYKNLKPNRTYKVVCFLPDLHWNYLLNGGPEKICDLMNRQGYDAAVTLDRQIKMAGGYPTFYPIEPNYYEKHLKMPLLHSPPCINPAFFRNLHIPRDIDAALLGCAVPSFYPIRWSIWNELGSLAIVRHWNVMLGGPAEHTSPYHKHIPTLYAIGANVGERYVNTLNRTKCFLFDCSVFGYTVYKFAEAQACGSLVMSDVPLDPEASHLIPEENFIPITLGNWRDRLIEVMRDEGLRERVAKAGYESTMTYNTTAVRAKALLSFLEAHLED